MFRTCVFQVRQIMHNEDPAGCLERSLHRFQRRQFYCPGPNFIWHADGYDKLKPFGFGIHGCIDGYSRRVLWLKVSYTNNCPSIVASYFVDCVASLRACPTVMRTDCGTENGQMAAIQTLLRRMHGDSQAENSHRYGSSISNQRIESWWSKFRRGRVSFFIGLFKDLVDDGQLDLHNSMHIACCRYAFMAYLQRELDLCVTYWNTHRIRNNKQYSSPGGIPDELYFLPQGHNASDYGKPIDLRDMAQYAEFVDPPSTKTGSKDIEDYLDTVMFQLGLSIPLNWQDCVRTYLTLRDTAENGH